MLLRRARREAEPLSGQAIFAHAWDQMWDLWRTQVVGAVIVAVLGFGLAWALSGFSSRVGRQVTTTVVLPVAAVALWLLGSGFWHLWRAPVRLARVAVDGHAAEIERLGREHSEHVASLNYGHGVRITELKNELTEARHTAAVLEEQARQPDRVALLRDACKDGKDVLTRLVILSTEDRRFEAACDWARCVWRMLREHFPQHSQDFYGPDSEATSWMFPISCRAEIDSMNGYVQTYVEAKLALLHDLLKQYDVSG